jgi:hypothetical protein
MGLPISVLWSGRPMDRKKPVIFLKEKVALNIKMKY